MAPKVLRQFRSGKGGQWRSSGHQKVAWPRARQEVQDKVGVNLAAKDPPGRTDHEDQTDGERCKKMGDVVHGPPSSVSVASVMLAVGQLALHCATTSRAQPSHRPHWVATPSSNWMSSKPMPARAWRAISRSETRRQTQTIMDGLGWLIERFQQRKYKYESVAFAIKTLLFPVISTFCGQTIARSGRQWGENSSSGVASASVRQPHSAMAISSSSRSRRSTWATPMAPALASP